MTNRRFAAVLALVFLGAAACGDEVNEGPTDEGASPLKVVTWVNPDDGATVSGTTTLEVTAPSGTATVVFKIDGNTVATDNASPWKTNYDTTELPDGSHTLLTKAKDSAGNVLAEASILVTVSNVTGPAIVGYAGAAGITGGQGGAVYTVSDWTPFKNAVLATGPRIVKLTGSNNFNGLGEGIDILNGDLTIDGTNFHGSFKRYSLTLRASNIILTQLRLRPGDQIDDVGEGDALTINPGAATGDTLSKVAIDHCSLLWAPDVTLGILNESRNVTVQYSVIGAGLVQSANPSSPNGYGPNVTTTGAQRTTNTTQYGRNITFYRNFIVHNDHRNIRGFGNTGVEYVNNVVYDWGHALGSANPRGMNVVGNMFKKGPETVSSNEVYYTLTKDWYPDPFLGSVYWDDNLGLGFTPTMNFLPKVRRDAPYDGGLHNVSATPASSSLASNVVAAAGPTYVDEVDQLMKNNFTNGTGSFWNGANDPAPNPYWPVP